MKPTVKDRNPETCPLCKTWMPTKQQAAGSPCRGPGCQSYLIIETKGKFKGGLVWHHPLECEEEPQPCAVCELWGPDAEAP